ncbi:GH25 family lysozyme [Eubacterium oxidoreducens]|uniref:Lyzozyme M1 (1,4-beta-N-acetylmuramidase), GH25 family n=1 Tax=Eubacterium oxidoreducens TaxID=1732 RepID=A0A1G6CE93_EUBOX|nr:GH25 family lysozyme [Eubacterium oxidoreducens]SDB31052.1 Lyzozyme M1 (1,4-beta-N-acetylmuramidase), GH25 family [Eubacterium oxidoreducens]
MKRKKMTAVLLAGVVALSSAFVGAFPGEDVKAEAATTSAADEVDDEDANSWRYQNGELIEDASTDYTLNVASLAALYKAASISTLATTESTLTIPSHNFDGIDVSKWQGSIDWAKVAATTGSSKVDFAIIRCGFGSNSTDNDDSCWETNADACEKQGIPYGVYLYSHATTTAELDDEIDHIIRLVKGHKIDLPIYLDMEDTDITSNCSKSQINALATYYVKKMQAKGYKAGIYASLYWWYAYLDDFATTSNGSYHWVAQYNSSYCAYADNDLVAAYNKSWATYNSKHYYETWQYASTGSVSGISGNVDMNYWYGSMKLANLSTCENASSGVSLSWKKVKSAKKYYVYRKVTGGTFSNIATTTSTSYVDTTAKSGTTYIYKIKYKTKSGTTGYGSKKTILYLKKPTITSVTNKASNITVKWNASKGATKYYVYRKSAGGSYSKIATVKNATSYKDTTAKNGTTYTYKVKAVCGSYTSVTSSEKIVRVSRVSIKKVSKIKSRTYKVTWSKNSSATGYILQYAKNSSFKNSKKVTIKGASSLKYTLLKLTKKKTYYFRVRVYKKVDGVTYKSAWSTTVKKKIS